MRIPLAGPLKGQRYVTSLATPCTFSPGKRGGSSGRDGVLVSPTLDFRKTEYLVFLCNLILIHTETYFNKKLFENKNFIFYTS